MTDTEGIILFRDNYAMIRDNLSIEQKGILLEALFDGEYSGAEPAVKIAFNVFWAAIQRSGEKYAERKETNRRNAALRWEKDRKIKEKAAAFDRMQLHPSASEHERPDASDTDTGSPAGAHSDAETRSFSDEVRAVLRARGATISEIDAAIERCKGMEIANPINYLQRVIDNGRRNNHRKVLNAQNFPQRDYSDADQEILDNLAREMEVFLADKKKGEATG